MGINSIKHLDWDSEFFNLKIASMKVDSLDPEFLTKSLNECIKSNYDLIYIILEGGTYLPQMIMELYHCVLVDEKIVYNSEVFEAPVISPFVEEFEGPPHLLYDLAIQAGVDSRYKFDENFSENDFLRLYKVWIDNSVNNTIADKVYVYKELNEIVGFITLKKGIDEVSIGLIATDTSQRGKGIGRSLLQAANKYTQESKNLFLNVATQKRNKIACSFYERNAMRQKYHHNIYHIWLKK